MVKCPICKDDVQAWDVDGRKHHLMVIRDKVGHIHTHGDLNEKLLMTEMIETAAVEAGQTISRAVGSNLKSEYVFHNRQRIGDILMFTAGVRDFKLAFPHVRVNVISTAAHIWDNNPYIDRTLQLPDDQITKIGPGKLTNASNRIDWHFANAYRVSIEDALGVHIPQGESRPDIWFTQEEYDAPRVIKQPYWLIVVSGEKGWGCKMYPHERWQEFVSQNPDITFVQLGTKGDNPTRLQGDNIIDMVGKTEDKDTGIRDLYKLFLNAEGSIGLVSFHMHLSGAFPGKPCIVVAGAREPVSFTQYPGHRYLATDGALTCGYPACWHCDINTCEQLVGNKVPKCVDLITPDDLTRALQMYYKGGKLIKGMVSPKPKVQIGKSTAVSVPVEKPVTESLFRPGTITEKDWEYLSGIIDKYHPKTILEFGSGLSTYLMSKKAQVTALEADPKWRDRAVEKYGALNIVVWDGKTLPFPAQHYDMAFVDGPSGGNNREPATKLASELADIVVTHDGWAKEDKAWHAKYLAPAFVATRGDGTRSMDLWVKKQVDAGTPTPPFVTSSSGQGYTYTWPITGPKRIKFVSTARGWGGCARSITTIMKFLLRAGHQVEFIPFHNKVGSREFREYIHNYLQDLIVTENFDTLKEKCDVLFVYADDFVWEFNRPDIVDAFSNLNADKKIMMLNYRRGGVGEIQWTRGWDKYMFLNSGQERELLNILPGAVTKVLPPCTELDEFLKVQPNYNTNLRIVRHNSQGDTKFDKGCSIEIENALLRSDAEVHMMPGPSFVQQSDRFIKYPKNQPPIPEFLSRGNLFWYSLPQGYMDMGPRVILEAMAAGIPVIADNWGGAPDRVTPDTGWICKSKAEMISIIQNVTKDELEAKGRAAKERAKKEFVPEKWVSEIVG